MTATQYIEGLRLKFFSPAEILYLGGANEQLQSNSEPPAELWGNITRTAQVADMAREALGRPVWVLSGYRNASYNSQVNGAPNSLHKEFNALDLRCAAPEKLWTVLNRFRNAGVFRGGLGLYSSFVHLDTRGQNATW